MAPVITSGVGTGSTIVSGEAIPNATPGNNCITIFHCAGSGPCPGSGNDVAIGTGSVNGVGVFVVTVSPALVAGERIFARDTCNSLNGPAAVAISPEAAPLMSTTMIGLLALTLSAVGLLSVTRGRRKGSNS